MNTPYTQRRAAQFRGPSTSDDYNKRIEENYNDLTILFNRASLSEVELHELYRRMAREHLSLSRALDDLENRIESLEEGAQRFTFYNSEQLDNDRFSAFEEFALGDELTLDVRHGVLTLPKMEHSSLSKLFYTNSEGEEVLPSTLETRVVGTVGTADSGAALIDQSLPEYALYRRPGLIWERNVVVNSENVNGAEVTLYIKVPSDLFTTADSNGVVIHPFPYFGTTIREIAYTLRPGPTLRDEDGYLQFNENGHYAGESQARGWVIPGGWSGAHLAGDYVIDSGPKAFHFSPKPITALRIKLHQPNYYREAGKFIYTYGLSSLDLRYDKFLSEGSALIRVDAPVGQTISSVNSVQPQIWNVSPALLGGTNAVFDHRVVWETYPGSNEPTLIPQPNSSRVWIEVTLKNTRGWTPVLSGLTVDYS